MNTEQRIQAIEERLNASLNPSTLEIIDESQQHVGHEGAKSGAGHFAIKVTSPLFLDKSLVECHRMIYDSLGDLMGPEIHALKIQVSHTQPG